jgi:hypothetical protein
LPRIPQARRLGGDLTISLEDVVRTTNASTRAVRALGIKPTAAAPPPSLRDYVTSRAGTAPSGPQSARHGSASVVNT